MASKSAAPTQLAEVSERELAEVNAKAHQSGSQARIDRSRAALMRTVSPADSEASAASTMDDAQWMALHAALMPPGQGGGTLLRKACRTGNAAKVRTLVAAGTSVHSFDEAFERTALHHAAHHGHVDCVRILLELDADVEATDLHHETPAHLAAERGHADVLKVLCNIGGANLRRRASNGGLALHYAAMSNHAAAAMLIVALMKERGELKEVVSATAFLNSDARRNSWGLTPAELARSKGQHDLADQIEVSIADDAEGAAIQLVRAS